MPVRKSALSCAGWIPSTCASASRTATATTRAAGFGDGAGLGLPVAGAGVYGVAEGAALEPCTLVPTTAAVRPTVPPTTANAPAAPTATFDQAGSVVKFMRPTVANACKRGR